MLKRRVLLLGAVALVAGVLAAHSPADARRGGGKGGGKGGVQIGGAKVNPRRMEGTGGTVSLSVRINAGGVALESVYAQATIPGTPAAGPTAALTSNGRFYTGTVTVPANPLPRAAFANIQVYAKTATDTPNRSVARIKMGKGGVGGGGGNDDLPPPPPSNF